MRKSDAIEALIDLVIACGCPWEAQDYWGDDPCGFGFARPGEPDRLADVYDYGDPGEPSYHVELEVASDNVLPYDVIRFASDLTLASAAQLVVDHISPPGWTGWPATAVIESAEEFVRLRTSNVIEECHRAAYGEAPLEVWWQVIEQYPDFKEWVIDNKTVPLVVLEKLACDPDPHVRWDVALRDQLPVALLEQLARDAAESVRALVATKRGVPADVLEQLARDTEEGVRARVTLNSSAPIELLQRLLHDESEFVRDGARDSLEYRGVTLA